jgi:hypothetical protein
MALQFSFEIYYPLVGIGLTRARAMLKGFEVSKNKACKVETEGQKFPNLHASSESISTHFMSP